MPSTTVKTQQNIIYFQSLTIDGSIPHVRIKRRAEDEDLMALADVFATESLSDEFRKVIESFEPDLKGLSRKEINGYAWNITDFSAIEICQNGIPTFRVDWFTLIHFPMAQGILFNILPALYRYTLFTHITQQCIHMYGPISCRIIRRLGIASESQIEWLKQSKLNSYYPNSVTTVRPFLMMHICPQLFTSIHFDNSNSPQVTPDGKSENPMIVGMRVLSRIQTPGYHQPPQQLSFHITWPWLWLWKNLT